MKISEQIRFESAPEAVRQALTGYVKSKYPKALDYIHWDSTGLRASASTMGVTCSLVLSGTGPTILDISGKIGFPASLAVSEAEVRRHLTQGIRDIKQETP